MEEVGGNALRDAIRLAGEAVVAAVRQWDDAFVVQNDRGQDEIDLTLAVAAQRNIQETFERLRFLREIEADVVARRLLCRATLSTALTPQPKTPQARKAAPAPATPEKRSNELID